MSTDQSRDGWPIGAGAVLYRTETWHDDEPEMWWVIDVARRPIRSEPADFGGGESTGVQEL